MTLATLLLPLVLAPTVGAKDLNGKSVVLPVPKKVTVLYFIGTECPIANRLAPELNRIATSYGDVAFFFVYSDGGKPAAAKDHYKQFELKAPAILDGKYKVCKFAGATVTPETAVYDKSGALVYRGRVNDSYTDHNQPRGKTVKNELRDALDAILKGKPVAERFVPAVGCAIPY